MKIRSLQDCKAVHHLGTGNCVFSPETSADGDCKLLPHKLFAHFIPLRHTRCPIWNTGGKWGMFDVKQLVIGGAVMALAEIVTVVIMIATR